MSESRIQDWIRYVQENAENVEEKSDAAQESDADSADASTRVEEMSPRKPPASADAPDALALINALAPAEDVSRRVAATLRARRSSTPRRDDTVTSDDAASEGATSFDGETAPGKPGAGFAHSEKSARKRAATRQRQRVETRAQLLERLTNPTITLHETSVILGVCSATVRRLTDCGELPHERTDGGQRRFRLMEVLKFQRDRREAKIARREAKNAR